MKNSNIFLFVVIAVVVLLIIFKDKIFDNPLQREMEGEPGPEQIPDPWNPTPGGGTGGTVSGQDRIVTISARFKTGKIFYKPNTWRDITPIVQAYANQHGGKIDIKSIFAGNSWIKKLGMPLSWGIQIPLPPLMLTVWTIQSPSAKIEFTFTTQQFPNPQTRSFGSSQAIKLP